MIETFLSRLEGVRKSGRDRWRAICPACGGKNRTKLSIAQVDGRILVYCFAGCETKDVVEAIGLTMGDLGKQDRRVPSGLFARDAVEQYRRDIIAASLLLGDVAEGRSASGPDRESARRVATALRALVQHFG